MHKLIGVLSLAAALVFSRSVKAQGFDLASLPSIDSISATTDMRPFLVPGVPLKMVRAALRRAWVVDLRIRDFRGLQENEWDFSDASGIPGFGSLEHSDSIKILQLMASVSWTAKSPRIVPADAPRSAGTFVRLCWFLRPLCTKV